MRLQSAVLFVILALSSSLAPAATFSSGISGGNVVSTVPGDYASLKDAGDDFSNYTGSINGNWTLSITGNLTETHNARFGNNVPLGRTVTIKPAPATFPIVTFTSETRNGTSGTIWDGHIVVGVAAASGANANATSNFVDTDNFIIDGSNTVSGVSRDLRFTNSTTTSTDVPRIMVHVIGRCDNVTVKNCVIDNQTSGASNGITTDNICVQFSGRRDASTVVHVPTNPRVENCILRATVGDLSQGVKGYNFGGSIPAGTAGGAITGMAVTKNDVTATLRGIFYDANAGGEISDNKVHMAVTTLPSTQRPVAIQHTGSVGVSGGWTMNILRNTVDQLKTNASQGILFAVGIGGGLTGTNTGVTNVLNNMIAGFDYQVQQTAVPPVSSGFLMRAISVENGAVAGATINIDHNSINMLNQPGPQPQSLATPGDPGNRLSVISLLNATGYAGTLNIRNNIIRVTQQYAAILSGPTGAATINFANLNLSNNTYFYGGTNTVMAKFNGTTYNTLADWQAAGEDTVGSNTADPLSGAPGSGRWYHDINLHFDAEPAAIYAAPVLAGAGNDVDNQVRPNPASAQIERGADEFYAPISAIREWMLF
ncbi:MAG: hypothetical protein ACR2IE_19745 [Candidatus Sumerlaeaceae bacterium]